MCLKKENMSYNPLELYTVKCEDCDRWLADMWAPASGLVYASVCDYMSEVQTKQHQCRE